MRSDGSNTSSFTPLMSRSISPGFKGVEARMTRLAPASMCRTHSAAVRCLRVACTTISTSWAAQSASPGSLASSMGMVRPSITSPSSVSSTGLGKRPKMVSNSSR